LQKNSTCSLAPPLPQEALSSAGSHCIYFKKPTLSL